MMRVCLVSSPSLKKKPSHRDSFLTDSRFSLKRRGASEGLQNEWLALMVYKQDFISKHSRPLKHQLLSTTKLKLLHQRLSQVILHLHCLLGIMEAQRSSLALHKLPKPISGPRTIFKTLFLLNNWRQYLEQCASEYYASEFEPNILHSK